MLKCALQPWIVDPFVFVCPDFDLKLKQVRRIPHTVTAYKAYVLSQLQMFARLSLQYLAPIIAGILVLEDTEAGRESVLYEKSHRGKRARAIALKFLATRRSACASTQDSTAQQKTLVMRQIEDVKMVKMANHMVSCDMCQTSIANVHRCVVSLPYSDACFGDVIRIQVHVWLSITPCCKACKRLLHCRAQVCTLASPVCSCVDLLIARTPQTHLNHVSCGHLHACVESKTRTHVVKASKVVLVPRQTV